MLSLAFRQCRFSFVFYEVLCLGGRQSRVVAPLSQRAAEVVGGGGFAIYEVSLGGLLRLSVTLALLLHFCRPTHRFGRHARVVAAFCTLKWRHSRVVARFLTASRCARVLQCFMIGRAPRSHFRSVRSCSSRNECHARVFARLRVGPNVMLAFSCRIQCHARVFARFVVPPKSGKPQNEVGPFLLIFFNTK